MSPLRVLLIDDQRSSCDAVQRQLAAHAGVTVAGAAITLPKARTLLATSNYDVVLLSPQLKQGQGLELVAAIRHGARLVLLVDGDRVAARPFEAAGVACLLKPVCAGPLADLLQEVRARPEPAPRFLPVRIGRLIQPLQVDAIHAIAARENYTEVALAGREQLFVRRTMQQWEELLPARQFVRVHRGLFVNLDRVSRTERTPQQSTRLHFANGAVHPLEVKRRHWPAVRDKLELWRIAVRASARAVQERHSIAVLPFANVGHDPANEIFCDGISEELLNVLAKLPQLRVAARGSAFSFKGRNVPPAEIAQQLGVDYLVEGSVRRIANRVRVTAHLTEAATGLEAWSDNFEHDLTDILAMQDAIAGEIAAQLHLSLHSRKRAGTHVDPEAHWLVLEGRHFWNLRTDESLMRAEMAFTKALAADPGFAPAHAGLADVCVVRAMYRLADGETDASDDLGRARREAQQALKLDPSLAEPHATLGFVSLHEGNMAAAARAFPRAFAANPNYATGYQFYAWTLCAQGRLNRALVEHEKAIARDPLSFINLDRYAAMLALAGRLDEALETNERAATLRPGVFVGNLSQRALILLALGHTNEAISAARTVRRVGRDRRYRRNADADAIFVLHQTGATAEAAEYAAEVLRRLPPDNYLRGFVLAAIERHAEAVPFLTRTPVIMLPQLYWSRLWDAAREGPEFQDLLRRIGRNAEFQRARETRG